jgi:uncharacterized protein YhbP (UPF0306 family)
LSAGRVMSKDFSNLHHFLKDESVLTISTNDEKGAWSAPVLYAADTAISPFALYFLSSPNSRHIKSLPDDGVVSASIYSDYSGNWQSICGAQMSGAISVVSEQQKPFVENLYFARFPEIRDLIDSPQGDQEQRIGAAFSKSFFYRVEPLFVRFTNNGDSFAGRTEWHF